MPVRANKRMHLAHVPITPALAGAIDRTPKDWQLIHANARSKPLGPLLAPEGLRPWRDKAMLSEELWFCDAGALPSGACGIWGCCAPKSPITWAGPCTMRAT